MDIRPLTDDDLPQAFALTRLSFGGDRGRVPPPAPFRLTRYGAFDDDGRMLAKAAGLAYEQWWGGRLVPMTGIAGVAVHPGSRGQGLVRTLLDEVLAAAGTPLSVLFPSAPGVYRGLGWEVVGTFDTTSLPVRLLPTTSTGVRAAVERDVPAITALYDERARQGNGLLSRTGPMFPPGHVLDADVCLVVESGGAVTGFLSAQREGGYQGGGSVEVEDCLGSADAVRALLGSLGSWSAVVDTVAWRGATDDLALHLGATLPPPATAFPWMLRVLDPAAAVAARGFGPGSTEASFALDGCGWTLSVADGHGRLRPAEPAGLPQLTTGGFALLYAGVAAGRLVRTGLADQAVPELEAAFAGPRPELLDYF